MNDFENELKKLPLRPVPPHWRAQILSRASSDSQERDDQPWWVPLLWPSPKAWGTLAAAWVLLFCFNLANRDSGSRLESPEAAQIRMAVQERRELQAELEQAALRLEDQPPKPRSQAAPSRLSG